MRLFQLRWAILLSFCFFSAFRVGANVLEGWNTIPYVEKSYGQEPNVYLLGEFHHNASDLERQLDLIRRVQPETVLHEFGGAFRYDLSRKEWMPFRGGFRSMGDMRSQSPSIPRAIVELSEQQGFQLYGNDITDLEMMRSYKQIAAKYPKAYRVSAIGRGEFELEMKKRFRTPELAGVVGTLYDPAMMEIRDEFMASQIQKFRSPNRSLVAIMGAEHSLGIFEKRFLQKNKIPFRAFFRPGTKTSYDILRSFRR
jgi:hypothetical protein